MSNRKRKKRKNAARTLQFCCSALVLALVIAIGGTLILTKKLKKRNADDHTNVSSAAFSEPVSIPELTDPESREESSSSPTESKAVDNQTFLKEKASEKTASLKKESDALMQSSSNTVKTQKRTTSFSNLKQRSVKLPVKFLAQNPELPTGCEITSLTTVLNFYGYSVSKITMANQYLEKRDAPADYRKYFIGTPADPNSFGCYAQPIVNAANKYFAENEKNTPHTTKAAPPLKPFFRRWIRADRS